MIFNNYTIYDSRAKEFGLPFFAKNDLVADRQLAVLLDSVPVGTRKDYVLFSLGSYDTDTGVISSTAPVEVVVDFTKEGVA